MPDRRALITGITGQDGSYLSELLLAKGYTVFGLYRPSESTPPSLRTVLKDTHAIPGVLLDRESIAAAVRQAQPTELYHLAAQSFVPGEEFATMRTNAEGTHHVLSAVRDHAAGCRVFLAGSSEMFGDADESPQTEATPLKPHNVYGISKAAAFFLMRHYRESHGLHASCGILYNHESPRRGEHFLSRKITRGAARIKLGLQSELRLGNLDSIRDWGHARDYVEAMWRMVQHPDPDDYIVATGTGRSVRQFVESGFAAVGLDWRDHVRSDSEFFRPAERTPFIGYPAKIREVLGWAATTAFEALVREMVEYDLALQANPPE
jgi:GDPmannose 4,6-dehydratase